jgi:N-acyl homoserine lactone hydrolase
MSAVEIHPIPFAELRMPRAYVFRPRGPSELLGGALPAPCLAYVIRHPHEGALLVDTGLHPHATTDLRGDFGLAMSLLFRGMRPAAEPYDEQLRALGVDPDASLRVVMTHLHVDHTSGMRLLPNARFLCTREEWAAARAPRAGAKGFIGRHLPDEARVERVDFDRDGERFGPFARTIDLFGDGSVRLVSTPGHTPGHMSTLLPDAGGREVLIVGDAAYTVESIERQALPLFTADERRYAASLAQLRAFAEEHPDALLVPSHDAHAWRALHEPATTTTTGGAP